MTLHPRPIGAVAFRQVALLALVVVAAATGCASRFEAETVYLAPGFTRASIRGQTIAVSPLAGADESASPDRAIAGVTRGMRDAGARVHVISSGSGEPAPAVSARPPVTDESHAAKFAVVFAEPESVPSGERADWAAAARRLGSRVGAGYLMHVRFSDANVYHRYDPPQRQTSADAARAKRTTGRRLAMRVALLRLPQGTPLWVADGTGELWQSRTDTVQPPAALATTASAVPITLQEDHAAGNLRHYPEAPPADVLTRRLTRRMLSHVPPPTELEPN